MRRPVRPSERLQASVEGLDVVAAVERILAREGGDAGQRVGHVGGARQVAAAEFGALDAEIGGGEVDHPLAEEIGLEPARAAIGADRRFGRQRQRHRRVDMGDPVGAAQELGDVARADDAVGPDIGADIGHRLGAQREDRPVAAAGDRDVAARRAGMGGGDQVFAPVLDPLDRAAEMPGGEGNQEILGKPLAAQPEPAADIVLHHGDGVLGEAELTGQGAAHREGRLGGARDGEPRAVPLGEQPARLQRHRRVAPDGKPRGAGIGGVREGPRRVALLRPVGDRDAVRRGVEQRCLARLDVELDRRGGVLGARPAVGEDQRHGLAHEADRVPGDHRLGEGFQLGQRAEPDRRHRHPPQPPGDVARGEHGRDAGHPRRAPGVDAADAPVRLGAPEQRRVQHAGPAEVVDIGAGPGEEARVLAARDRRADQDVAHGVEVPLLSPRTRSGAGLGPGTRPG